MIHIGPVSFSMYVIHFMVVVFAGHLASGATVAAPLAYPLVLAGAVGLASVSHQFIERPAIALGRRLARIPAGHG